MWVVKAYLAFGRQGEPGLRGAGSEQVAGQGRAGVEWGREGGRAAGAAAWKRTYFSHVFLLIVQKNKSL